MKKLPLAPIVLFVYNRPGHTRQTVESLQKNELARESDLFIFSDGPGTEADGENVKEVRSYIRTVAGFKKITIVEREKNWGLADSIIDGVTRVVNAYGRVIVLEDDLVTGPFFLRFINEALALYKDETRVWHITGYMFPIDATGLPQTVFYRCPTTLGWATWQRAWKHFRRDPAAVIAEFSPRVIKRFNLDGCCNFWDQVMLNYYGGMRTWAVFWYAAVFKQGGLCLHPVETMVQHIGYDDGTHFKRVKRHDPHPSLSPITYFETDLTEKKIFIKRLKAFYKQNKRPLWKRVGPRIRSIFFQYSLRLRRLFYLRQ
ncbi:MAG: sugar transferase [Thermodesulfobacteriota bacterium]